MISAVVIVPDKVPFALASDREILMLSLVWLVSAVVSGVVHDVTLAGPESRGLIDVADQAGCNLVHAALEADRLSAALAAGKHALLLLIEVSFQPTDSMIAELEVASRPGTPRESIRLLAAPATPFERLFPNRTRTVGLFAPIARFRALKGGDFHDLVAQLKPKARFATRAFPIL